MKRQKTSEPRRKLQHQIGMQKDANGQRVTDTKKIEEKGKE